MVCCSSSIGVGWMSASNENFQLSLRKDASEFYIRRHESVLSRSSE